MKYNTMFQRSRRDGDKPAAAAPFHWEGLCGDQELLPGMNRDISLQRPEDHARAACEEKTPC